MKIGTVRNGLSLQWVQSTPVQGAKLFRGKLPQFVATTYADDGRTVKAAGHWRGGDSWQANTVPGPWGLPGVV